MATNPYPSAGRGLSIGAVLARAFGAIGSAPVAFFGTSALLVAAPSLAFRLTVGNLFTPDRLGELARTWPILVAGGLAWWLLYLLAQTLIFLLTAAAGERRRMAAGALLVAAVRVLPAVFVQSVLLTIALTLGSILLLVPGLLLWLLWGVAAPALAIERQGLFAAFGRSQRLTVGARWAMIAILVVVFAIYFAASGVSGVISLAANGIGGIAARTGPTYVATSILSALLQLAFATIWSAIKAALFLELREVKDGPAGETLAGIFA